MTVKHGATANNIAFDAWVKIDSTITAIDTNSEFFEITIQRNSVSSTTGYDGNYMARTIYAISGFDSDPAAATDTMLLNQLIILIFNLLLVAHLLILLLLLVIYHWMTWHHVWCEYTVTSAPIKIQDLRLVQEGG